jgi:hypothetical protein
VSEYQYYEFQAVDRPLGDRERAELRKLSSRARITASSFTNSYDWGDFRGDPAKLMERYFDLFLYLANWGSRRFSISLPRRIVTEADLDPFFAEQDVATVHSTSDKLIIDVCRDEIDVDDFDDGTGRLAGLAPLRADVLGGDLRIFYLIWLLAVENGDVPDDAVEPLAGIGPITPALEEFADFFLLDRDLLEAAAGQEVATPAAPLATAVAQCLRSLPEDDKVALLVRVYEGNDPYVRTELRRRVHSELAVGMAPGERRTVAELRALADRRAAERERAAAKRAEAERRRREREEAEAKTRRLEALGARGEAAWREVETMIELRKSSGYERAVALLIDLRDLARNQGRPE